MDVDCDDLDLEVDPSLETAGSSMISRMALNDNKAGMQGLDKERINKIIHENSVGSKFYENERKKDATVNERINKLLVQMQQITPEQMDAALGQTNKIIEELEGQRDLSKTIVHIDMDAFYASVEERDHPELKDKPMAVGGMGMLSTSNYIARRYGVRAAMPGFIGKKLCPELVLVPLNFSKYTRVSNEVREILKEYDPHFAPMGLDEAYLDITPYLERRKIMPESERTFRKGISKSDSGPDTSVVFGTSTDDVVQEIRFRIEQKTMLTASAGIAPNTLLAKVASDMNKPNGQFLLEFSRSKVLEFVRSLSIRKISGIGKVSEKLLNSLGVKTCQDLFEKRALLFLLFSNTMSYYFLRVAIGMGSTVLGNDSERKSISTERTFQDISNPEMMFRKCEEICDALGEDVKRAGMQGNTVTLKIKLATFEMHTRSKTLLHPVSSKSEVYPIVTDLLRQELAVKKHMSLRLIGVGLSKLTKVGQTGQKQKSLEYFLTKSNQKIREDPKSKDTSEQLEIGERFMESHSCGKNSHSIEQLPFSNDSCDGTLNVNTDSPPEAGCSSSLSKVISMPDETKNISKGHPTNSCTVIPQSIRNFPSTREYLVHNNNTLLSNCGDSTSSFSLSINEAPDDVSESHCQDPQRIDNTAILPNMSIPEILSGQSGDSVTDEVNGLTTMTCPICNATFYVEDVTLAKFNDHLDSCLNHKTIKDLVQSEKQLYCSQTTSTSKKRKKQHKTPTPKRTKQPMTLDMYLSR